MSDIFDLDEVDDFAYRIWKAIETKHDDVAREKIKARDAAQRQAGREERCDNCDRDSAINAFRADELDAVMLSVDKWLEGPALKNNPATRAADAREVALKAIEKESTRAEKLETHYAALVEAAREMVADDLTVEQAIDRAVSLRKALSDLDEGRKG